MKRLSIITINYNNVTGLAATFNSVFNQSCSNFEYVVIDGGSKDGSKALMDEHEGRIDFGRSEPDKGIYNAMNVGIQHATGEYCLFLNSGDVFYDKETVDTILPLLHSEDIIYGNMVQVANKRKTTVTFPPVLNDLYFFKYSLPHPASFIRRKLLLDSGMYNEGMKIVSDWAFFMIAILKHHKTYRHINEIICVFDTEGLSSQRSSRALILNERADIIKANFPEMQMVYDRYQVKLHALPQKLLNAFARVRRSCKRLIGNNTVHIKMPL